MPGIFYTLVFLATSFAVAPVPVEIVLDGSESMLHPVAESTIQAIVRDALVTVVAEAESKPERMEIGLRLAGGTGESGQGCSAADPLILVGDPKWSLWTKALNGIKPAGRRSLNATVAAAITNVARDDGKSRVVVITTGGDQCDTPLHEVSAALAAVGHSVELRLVGLNLDAASLEAFESVPLRNATNPADLIEAIRWGVIEFDAPNLADSTADPAPPEIVAALTVPSRIAAGEDFELTWSGPESPEDFLSLAPAGSADDHYLDWARTEDGQTVVFHAPDNPGEYEVRYVDGSSGEALARTPITVEAVAVTIEAPATAAVELRFSIVWTGPASPGDFLSVSRPETPPHRYSDWTPTTVGSPATLAAPWRPGIFEVRYVTGGGTKILARTPIEIHK